LLEVHSAVPEAEQLLFDLTPQQADAAFHAGSPLLILAGAGSGKTRTLTRKVAYLTKTAYVSPWQVLAITFTNRAAGEMRGRIADLVGEEMARRMNIGTFHAVSARALRDLMARSETVRNVTGRTAHFSIYDDTDAQRVLRDAVEATADAKRLGLTTTKVWRELEHARRRGLDPGGLARDANAEESAAIAAAWWRYQERKRRQYAMDFGDLLGALIGVFCELPHELAAFRARHRAIFVDEYQDTDPAQYRWLRMIADGCPDLCCVGDDQQSIYRWRGADVNLIRRFGHDFTGARIVSLDANFRSSQPILDAATRLIGHNAQWRPRKLRALRQEGPDGPDPRVLRYTDGRAEAQQIALWARRAIRAGRRAGDLCVLYRSDAIKRELEQAFLAAEIPYKPLSGVAFFGSQEVKDCLAWLRLAVNPNDAVALARAVAAPPRGVSTKGVAAIERRHNETGDDLVAICADPEPLRYEQGQTMPRPSREGLRAFARQVGELARRISSGGGLREAIEYVAYQCGLDRYCKQRADENSMARATAMHDLIAAADNYERHADNPTLHGLLEQAALIGSEPDPDRNAVTLATVHAAKGLEWRSVWVAAMEEGVFPSYRVHGPLEHEEERRVAYVAMTRARDVLVLSSVGLRNGRTAAPSRYIAEALGARPG
jgi:DNA helicase II / ATP-dependent DNA helicase PcrA